MHYINKRKLKGKVSNPMRSSPGAPYWLFLTLLGLSIKALITLFSGSFHVQATPLDKEGQVFRRGCHPDVKPLLLQMMPTVTTDTLWAEPPSCLPGLPVAPLPLTPDTFPNPGLPSDSDDISISSASTACSPNSSF